MSQTDPSKPVAQRRKLKFAVALLLIPVWCLIAEFGYRGWLWARGEPYSAAAVETELPQILAELTQRVPGQTNWEDARKSIADVATVLHPFIGFAPTPLFEAIDQTSEYYADNRSPVNFDVLILGGSVAANFGNWAGQTLAPKLAADPRLKDRHIRIHGFGTAGFKQPQQLNLLSLMFILGHKPDAVITLDGFNELTVAGDNASQGISPAYPSWFEMTAALTGGLHDPRAMDAFVALETSRRKGSALIDRAKRWNLTASAIIGKNLVGRMTSITNEGKAALRHYRNQLAGADIPLAVRGHAFKKDRESVLAACVRTWKEGARGMQALCRDHGVMYLHVMQPCLDDPGSKPLTPEEIEKGPSTQAWTQAVLDGYPLLRAAGQELLREGVNFLDATRVFAEVHEKVYLDGCHFGDVGSEHLSRLVAPRLLELLPPPGAPGEKPPGEDH